MYTAHLHTRCLVHLSKRYIMYETVFYKVLIFLLKHHNELFLTKRVPSGHWNVRYETAFADILKFNFIRFVRNVFFIYI